MCCCCLQVFSVSMFGSTSQAVKAVSRSKKLILSSTGKGATEHGDSLLCFTCSNVNGSMLRLGSEDYWGCESAVLGGRLRFHA